MHDFDELLQRKIEDLEDGASPDRTAKSLPGEAFDLEPLVYLAASLKELPYPELGLETSRTMQRELVKAARGTMKLPMRKHAPSLAWLLSPGFASLTLAVLILGFVFFGGRAWLAGPVQARTALLTEVTGQVQVADQAGNAWKDVGAGAALKTAQVLRTLEDSSATLQFFDGTQTTLEPNTSLVLDEVAGGWGTVLRVTLTQQYGVTDHQVVPFAGKDSHFTVNTPSGAANVSGTDFSVAVDPQGKAFFTVIDGQVQVENQQGEVTLDPGFGTAASLSQSPEPPAYIFTLEDTLARIDGDVWWVGGMPFVTTAQTFFIEQMQPGMDVQVTGRILENGQWVVDTMRPASQTGRKSLFTGVVNELGEEVWNINGIAVQVDLTTRLSGIIQVGDVVEVKYVVKDSGPWRALEIVNLFALGTPSQLATLTSAPSPDEPVPPEAGSLSVQELENCTGADPHPEAVALAKVYAVEPQVIMSWFCQGFGFGEINQAYNLSKTSGAPVADIFAERQQGKSWGDIKKEHPPKPSNENKPSKENNSANENRQPTKTPKK